MKGLPENLTLKTPAKINLFLHVKGKRSDGYHDIITVFQMIDLWDEIVLERSQNLDVICSNPEIPSGQENLIYKAMLKIKEHSGYKHGAKITLIKDIPVAAGLGGGSSDASAALFGLNILWGLGYDNERLKSFARELGSDIPFFLNGPAAIGYNRGEELIPLDNNTDYWFLITNPGIPVSTAWAYSEFSYHQQNLEKNYETLQQVQGALINNGDIVNKYKWIGPFSETKIELTNMVCHIKIPLPDCFRVERGKIWFLPFNDLEEVVIKRHQIIKQIKEKMVACGALYSLMSGSGSTVFGIFIDRKSAERADKVLHGPGWRSWIVKALKSSPYSYYNYQT
ncbi:MAG: 4-(cytidine 5'-diphospho)-2-C-methyl-D-erythritol kinase [Nitrospirae bacterium RIFCSPLOWO2_02_42_7]|nr:MAG: 4-(cytidine 5'-diphospho)-2-C-methyl-D-erythritol kinase [Nitrospirae bacterium RIFCSPLOWO2_02_42_7]